MIINFFRLFCFNVRQASSYPNGCTELFQTKNPNCLQPKDPQGTNPLTLPLAYVSMRRDLCVAFFVNYRLLSESLFRCKQFRLLRAVFPPQYLNYSHVTHLRILCQILKLLVFNNFPTLEANLLIAKYYYYIGMCFWKVTDQL